VAWREQGGSPGNVFAWNDAERRAALSPVGDLFLPVASSALRPGWDRILVELHQVTDWAGGARLPQHSIALTLSPPRRMCVRLEGGSTRTVRPAAGDVIVVPGGQMHWGAWEGRFDFLLAYLAPDTLERALSDDGLDAARLEVDYRFGAHDPEIASLLLALRGQLLSPGGEDHLYVDTLSVQLAVDLLRLYGTAPLQLRSYRHGLSRPKMRLVLEYVNAHLSRNIHLAELARLADMSQFHFLRQFRNSAGVTPHHYLVRRRVEVATDILLREDTPLADVAYRVGFADQSHFSRHFRRITGTPPGRLRRQRRAV
jgi:AraC family transcriptional regulator